MARLALFRNLGDALKAGWQVYDRTKDGYIVRRQTEGKWEMGVVDCRNRRELPELQDSTHLHFGGAIAPAKGIDVLPGIDVSFAQGNPSWDEVAKSARVKWVVSRACYGSNPADDDGAIFVRNHDACKRLGIPFGAYIFFLFGQDPIAQAQHFLQAADGRFGEIRPMVDVEEGSGSTGSVAGNIAALAAFDAEIQRQLSCQPILYTNADTWNTAMGGTSDFSGHSLWVASYGANDGSGAGNPTLPTGFTTWAIHQYTSQGIIPGITANTVDLDVVNGDSLEGLLR